MEGGRKGSGEGRGKMDFVLVCDGYNRGAGALWEHLRAGYHGICLACNVKRGLMMLALTFHLPVRAWVILYDIMAIERKAVFLRA